MSVDELIARSEIGSLLARYAHGVDRADWPLVRACYHDDAHDDHGLYRGGVDGLMLFLQQLSTRLLATTHQLGLPLIELQGSTARCLTPCVAWYRRQARDGSERTVAQGLRYLDELQCRSGRWAIARRLVVLDWEQLFEPSQAPPPAAPWQRGARGPQDPSHEFFSSSSTPRGSVPHFQPGDKTHE